MAKRLDAKSQFLHAHGTLNLRPELVADELFQHSDFFDPRDLLLVKYEMLRRVRREEMDVTQAAVSFGFSRPSFYQAQTLFQQGGLAGLIPRRPGPQHAHKLSDEVLDYVQQQQALNELLRAPQMCQLVLEKFGLSVHPRSIERALQRRRKGALAPAGDSTPISAAAPNDWLFRYEELRRRVVAENGRLPRGPGIAVFVQQGLAAWMHAWPKEISAPISLPASHGSAPLPAGLYAEVTQLLVHMVFHHRQEALA